MALFVTSRSRGSIATLIEMLVVLIIIAVLSIKFLKIYVRPPSQEGAAPAGNYTAIVDTARTTLDQAQEDQKKRFQGLDAAR